MRLQEIMSTKVISIGPEASAEAAWARMDQRGIRHLVVKEGARLVGVISERDLGGRKGGVMRRGRTVRELMTEHATIARPTTTLRQAANLMRGRLIGSLPVVDDDGQLVGIVTATDVLDELGRASARPSARAERRTMRVSPAGARAATRRQRRKTRAPKRTSEVIARRARPAMAAGARAR